MGDEFNIRGKVFQKGVGFNVGEGSLIHFSVDDCVGVGGLSVLFPRLYMVVPNKNVSVKECYVPVENGAVSWDVPFRRVLHRVIIGSCF